MPTLQRMPVLLVYWIGLVLGVYIARRTSSYFQKMQKAADSS